jgi:hypothetical protein
LTADTWRSAIAGRLAALDWDHLVADVRPFLEPSAHPDLLTRDNLLRVLE